MYHVNPLIQYKFTYFKLYNVPEHLSRIGFDLLYSLSYEQKPFSGDLEYIESDRQQNPSGVVPVIPFIVRMNSLLFIYMCFLAFVIQSYQ